MHETKLKQIDEYETRTRNTDMKHRHIDTHAHIQMYKYTHINTARHANTQKIASHMNAH